MVMLVAQRLHRLPRFCLVDGDGLRHVGSCITMLADEAPACMRLSRQPARLMPRATDVACHLRDAFSMFAVCQTDPQPPLKRDAALRSLLSREQAKGRNFEVHSIFIEA